MNHAFPIPRSPFPIRRAATNNAIVIWPSLAYNSDMRSRQRRILLAIPTNGSDGRLRLGGILRFASSRPNWDLKFIRSRTGFNDGEVEALMSDGRGIDGCILAAYTPAVERLLENGVPCVAALENLHERLRRHPSYRAVFIDNAEIGEAAAEHFKSLGCFSSYTFVPAPPSIRWSLDRKAAFKAAADKRAAFFEFPETAFEMTNLSGENGIQMREGALEDFMRALPKPAAVFGANDILAMQVLKACRNARVKVPAEVAVMGCDNDELICLNTKPQLTSIQPNFDLAGYTAAQMLNAMMLGKHVKKEPAIIGKLKLFPRSTTNNLPPSVVLVNHAMEYIAGHATEGISTADVIRHLRVSRSLLDLRFRQLKHRSVMDEILAVRLEAVKRALKTTNRKILAIGRECGFGNPDYLKRLFKKRYGMSMREWRAGGRGTGA